MKFFAALPRRSGPRARSPGEGLFSTASCCVYYLNLRNYINMKITRGNVSLSCMFFYILLFNSCCRNCDEYSVETAEFDGSRKAIEEFYSPDLVEALVDLGFNLNVGSTPPNVEGNYFISPL